MADVFISYREKSAGELAAQIAAALESAGISCWYAKRDIPPGGDFARYIPPQINACQVFLLILTDGVCESRHVQNEVGLAFSRLNKEGNITILPFQADDVILDYWATYYLIHTQIMKAPLDDLTQKITEMLDAHPKKLSSNIIDKGACGDSVEYTLDENGLLVISGSGSMWDFDYDNQTHCVSTPWCNFQRSDVKHVQIKNGVTCIGCSAFRECAGLTRVKISDSVTKIGDWAFAECAKLAKIEIPDSVTKIGDWAFAECAKLAKIEIPDSVLYIGKWSFFHCAALSSVTIPSSISVIAKCCFYQCEKLRSVTISNGVNAIQSGAFANCAKLTKVTIPDSVHFIGKVAFYGCTNLTNIRLLATTTIERYAFPQKTAVIRRLPCK